jgi:hypothetical protein
VAHDFQMPPVDGPLHLRREARQAMGEAIERLSAATGYKFGPRGWAYYAEGLGLITKGEFARFEKLLTDMRKDGELDPDVIEPDGSRMATEVNDFEADDDTPEEHAQYAVNEIGQRLNEWASIYRETGYWSDLDYYVEMIVEKKDLVQIFRSTADRYRVRITNGKGDTDIHTRLAMLKRFRDHTDAGRQCVLLAIGDHDPKGKHIVQGLQRTIMSCANIKGLDWPDPDFEVVNIGLTEQQVFDLELMRIGNLETGGGRDLSDPRHPDHFKPYVQDYIALHGVWKCEANALVGHPRKAEGLLETAINRFIPASHPADIKEKNAPGQSAVRAEIARLMKDWTFEDEE